METETHVQLTPKAMLLALPTCCYWLRVGRPGQRGPEPFSVCTVWPWGQAASELQSPLLTKLGGGGGAGDTFLAACWEGLVR